MRSNHQFWLVLMVVAILGLAACSGETGSAGPAGEAGPAGSAGAVGPAGPAGAAADVSATDLTCTNCHNDTTLIVSKQSQFALSHHATGDAYLRGTSDGCAGCHGSEGASLRIDAGLAPHDESVAGTPNVSPYNCRTCHDIHTTYTAADFSNTGDQMAVALENTPGTFDKGAGNLCANCHQIRNELPVAVDGMIEFESTRFGTHHGVESQMLLGEGGLLVPGSPGLHYQVVEDTCVTCHMGENRNHTFEPNVANCQACHADLDTFDRNDVQTEISATVEEVKALLIASGIMDEENRSIPGAYPEEVAAAMWNYMFVIEDQSLGVHNSVYARALLQQALDALSN